MSSNIPYSMYGFPGAPFAAVQTAQFPQTTPGTSSASYECASAEPTRKRRNDDGEKENLEPKHARLDESESSEDASDRGDESEAEDAANADTQVTPVRGTANANPGSMFNAFAQYTPMAGYNFGMNSSASPWNSHNFPMTPQQGMGTSGPMHSTPLAGYNNSQTYGSYASPWANISAIPSTPANHNGRATAAAPSPASGSSGSSSGQQSSDSGILNGSDDKQLVVKHAGPLPSVNMDMEFARVNARLTLLGTKKYVVTVGEMLRRTNAPELLNSSILGGYLRRAKNLKSGDSLRQEFKEKVGIPLPQGRRKADRQNCFTAIIEQEAAALVSDYSELSIKHFPHEHMAHQLVRGSQLVDIQSFYSALTIVSKAIDILNNDRSPGTKRGEENLKNPTTAHPDDPTWVAVSAGLEDFSLRTHGFGVPAQLTAWQSLARVFQMCIQLIGQGTTRPMNFQMPTAAAWSHSFPGSYAPFAGFPHVPKLEPPHGFS